MKWLNANRLSLNIDKTYLDPSGNEICPTININGSSIQEVDNAKFLGIIIDNKLNWLEHIKCISHTIAKGTGSIIKSRKSFETKTLLHLHNALIFPHISCIHVWGTTASVHLHRPSEKIFVDQVRDYCIELFMCNWWTKCCLLCWRICSPRHQ